MSTDATSKKYIILAPHVDDEVIGCYRLLRQGLVQAVFYFYELSDNRIAEGKACAKYFGFRANFLKGIVNGEELFQLTSGYKILVPHVADQHPHHKMLNHFAHQVWAGAVAALQMSLEFYSVDMNVKVDLLDEEMRREKQQTLYSLFPSQQPLFNQDSKYFLFETLLVTDWTEMLIQDREHFVHKQWVKPAY